MYIKRATTKEGIYVLLFKKKYTQNDCRDVKQKKEESGGVLVELFPIAKGMSPIYMYRSIFFFLSKYVHIL